MATGKLTIGKQLVVSSGAVTTSAPLLDLAQRQVGAELNTQGWLPIPVMEYVAKYLDMPVIRVVDGDTLHVLLNGRDTTVRLIGMNTPETVKPNSPVECFGPQASDYAKQLLHLRAAEATGEATNRGAAAIENELYSERFLVKRALLRAIAHREGPPPILLIDEVDRALHDAAQGRPEFQASGHGDERPVL